MCQSSVSQSTTMKLKVRDLEFSRRWECSVRPSSPRLSSQRRCWAFLGMRDPVQEGATTIRNAVNYTPSDTALHPTTPQSSLHVKPLLTV
jgi:hypothetical protein